MEKCENFYFNLIPSLPLSCSLAAAAELKGGGGTHCVNIPVGKKEGNFFFLLPLLHFPRPPAERAIFHYSTMYIYARSCMIVEHFIETSVNLQH